MAEDKWGSDPQVRFMRGIFSRIEKAHWEFLEKLGLSPFDLRLRRWRDGALYLFEKSIPNLQVFGLCFDDVAERLYLSCLAEVMERTGFPIERSLDPRDETMKEILREAYG